MGFWSSLFQRSTAITAPRSPRRMQTRRYRAPVPSNSTDGFLPTSGHERVPSALRTISARARDLAHNNPLAKRAVTVLTAHTVGKGIRFSFTGDKAYDAAFFEWATKPANCDHERRLNFFGQQHVAARTMFEAGDSFIIMREVRDTATGQLRLTLQLVDPDLVDTGARPKTAGNECVSGVEIDKTGLVVGYHFRSSGESSGAGTFVPVEDVVHLYETVYPGQLRGIPRGAQALLYVDDQASLMSAAIAKLRVETCAGIAIIRNADDVSGGILGGEDDGAEPEGDYGYRPERLDTGMIIELRPGEDIKTIPASSGSGVIDYMRVSMRAIAMAYDVTYSQLTGDLEKVNFSSEKAGRMEFNRVIDATREHFILAQLSKIEARFRAVYEANGGTVAEELEVTIVPPGRERIEPAKEVLADMTEMSAGLKSFAQACLERGLDPEVQLEEVAIWSRRIAEAGAPIKFGSLDVTTAALAAVVAAEEQAQVGADNSTSPDEDEE